MHIRPINFTNNNINFQRKGRPQTLYYKVYDPEMLYSSPEQYKKNLLRGVPHDSRKAMFDVLNECYEYGKQEFPNDKITLFFTTKQNRRAMNNAAFILGFGVNTKAKEGIIRSEEDIPGFSDSRDADYYDVQVLYSHSKEKLTNNALRAAYLLKFKDGIQEFKSAPKEEKEKTKQNIFARIFQKLFN